MFIKRFVVKSLPEVMSLVRRELGADAVILSSRKVRKPGIAGWLGWTAYEVVAAVDQGQAGHTGASLGMDEPTSMKRLADQRSPSPIDLFASHSPQLAAVDATQFALENAHDANELLEIKNLLVTMLFDGFPGALATATDWQRQLVTWAETGLSPVLLRRFMNEYMLRSKELNPAMPLRDVARGFIRSVLDAGGPCRLIAPSDHVVLFIGPTGVGKTTTIAKLAAQARIRDGRRVGLLTVDTFRVGAAEQLRTYADILNIPMAVAHTSHEVAQYMERMADCDLVLVDTMGHSFLDEGQAAQLRDLVSEITFDIKYLVLSLTARKAEAKEIARTLLTVGYDALLFTKNDEALLPSLAVTLVDELKRPLSYIATGQQVPGDLAVADAAWLSSLFAGGERSG